MLMIKRGDIYFADLSPVVGSEQGGVRPVLILQNDTGNRFSPTVIVAAITSQTEKVRMPTHIKLEEKENGLPRKSVVLLEQIRTIDKTRLQQYIGHLAPEAMRRVDDALRVSFGFLANTKE
jgi:mRNA interferase MazF